MINVLAARLLFQVMSETAVSVLASVVSVDSSQHVLRVADVVVISTSISVLGHVRVSDDFIERLLESLLPDRSLRSVNGGDSSYKSSKSKCLHINNYSILP